MSVFTKKVQLWWRNRGDPEKGERREHPRSQRLPKGLPLQKLLKHDWTNTEYSSSHCSPQLLAKLHQGMLWKRQSQW